MHPRRCVLGRNPDDFASIPNFETPYFNGEAIQVIAEALIAEHQELSWLREDQGHDYKVIYFWKKSGGTKQGNPVFGTAGKVTGLMHHLTGDATFVITMMADHLRGFANYEFEAAIYHQLLHLTEDETETAEGEARYVPTIRGHEFEGFLSEIDRYGLWSTELRSASDAYAKQLKLDLRPATTTDVADDNTVIEAGWTVGDETRRRKRQAEVEAEDASAAERELAATR